MSDAEVKTALAAVLIAAGSGSWHLELGTGNGFLIRPRFWVLLLDISSQI